MAGLVPFNRSGNDLMSSGFQDFYNLLDDFFTGSPVSSRMNPSTFQMNIEDKENEYVVEALLPGIQKDEIQVEMKEGRLNIQVQRNEEKNQEEKNYLHKESHSYSMNRSVFLRNASDEDIKAKLQDGVLCIHVPKKEPNEQKKLIDIE